MWWWVFIVGYSSSLPIHQDHLCCCIQVRLATSEHFAIRNCNLSQEVYRVIPGIQFICPSQMLWICLFQNAWDVIWSIGNFFNTLNTTQDLIGVCSGRNLMNRTRAINEVYLFGECHILPYFRFPRDWRRPTSFFAFECIDDRRLANIGIPYKANTCHLLLVVEARKLP